MPDRKKIRESSLTCTRLVALIVLAMCAVWFARPTDASRMQSALAVVSAASYKGDALSAEQIVVAFGSNLADSIVIANTFGSGAADQTWQRAKLRSLRAIRFSAIQIRASAI